MNSKLLIDITAELVKLSGITSVALSGSAATNKCDNNSDFDLYVYADEQPPLNKRKAMARKFSDYMEIGLSPWEPGDEWIARAAKTHIDIMYRHKTWITEQINRVWIGHNASLGYTTCFVYNVYNSKILYDTNGWFKELKTLTQKPYPGLLAKNIINKNLPLLEDTISSYYAQIKKAAAREDFISVNHRTAAYLASYFDILFAANSLLHPGEKRLLSFALNNCKKLPANFEEDINNLLALPAKDKLPVLTHMTKALKSII